MKKMTFFITVQSAKWPILLKCEFAEASFFAPLTKKFFWALLSKNVRFSNRKVSSLHAPNASPSVWLRDCFFCRWLALLCLPVCLQLMESNWRLQWACRSRNASQQNSGKSHQHHLLHSAHCRNHSDCTGILHALAHYGDPSSHQPKFRQLLRTCQKIQAPNWTGMDFFGQIQRILAIDPSRFMPIFHKQKISIQWKFRCFIIWSK